MEPRPDSSDETPFQHFTVDDHTVFVVSVDLRSKRVTAVAVFLSQADGDKKPAFTNVFNESGEEMIDMSPRSLVANGAHCAVMRNGCTPASATMGLQRKHESILYDVHRQIQGDQPELRARVYACWGREEESGTEPHARDDTR